MPSCPCLLPLHQCPPVHAYSNEPSALLKRYVSVLPKGKALDVAMGEGRNSLFLASRGFDMEGVERSPEAVQRCREESLRRNLTVRIVQADLETYKLKKNEYDLVLCFYYLQRSLIPQMKRALKKGGMIVYETFLIDQHLRHGHPKRSEFCFQHNELLDFFKSYRVLLYEEGFPADEPITTRLIAVK